MKLEYNVARMGIANPLWKTTNYPPHPYDLWGNNNCLSFFCMQVYSNNPEIC